MYFYKSAITPLLCNRHSRSTKKKTHEHCLIAQILREEHHYYVIDIVDQPKKKPHEKKLLTITELYSNNIEIHN
jgi:hypothetical protein